MTIDVEKIGIKIKLTEGKLKAIVGLDFGDVIIRGFRIQESQHENDRGEKIWVTPPSYLGGGKWHPIAFFSDKDLWKKIEGKIYDAYAEVMKKRLTKAYGLSEEETSQYFSK
ncbi:MAG: hypothetical protein PHN39_04100 [Candidatus Pacebacteria bacterium]|nr:hypothetical protein [Candidatus Paceibacterota bacterium]